VLRLNLGIVGIYLIENQKYYTGKAVGSQKSSFLFQAKFSTIFSIFKELEHTSKGYSGTICRRIIITLNQVLIYRFFYLDLCFNKPLNII
jgi:hypothetical protein